MLRAAVPVGINLDVAERNIENVVAIEIGGLVCGSIVGGRCSGSHVYNPMIRILKVYSSLSMVRYYTQ
jgi:hypothetical protein